MRSMVEAWAVALSLLLATPLTTSTAAAQDAPAAAAPPAALPNAPIPYNQIRPKAAPRRARPGTATTARPAGAAVAAAGATVPGAVPPRPVIAGAAPIVPGLPVGPAGARLAPGQPIPAVELEAYVDGVVRQIMADAHLPGAAVSVVQNGQVLLNKGYGFARLSPAKAVDANRTLFRIGSISKTFTWIALMKEVEAGRIRLNQPVNLYLPERVQVRDQGFEQPVRVINLMDHTAGFESRVLGQLFERDFERVRPLDLYLRQERPRRVRAPGAFASYSNYGAALAGQAAAYTSGKPFERLMEEQIFIPLGLRQTTFREPRPEKAGLPAPMPVALIDDVADGFAWDGGFRRQPYEFMGQIAPAGSASSSAGDMARYMLLLLGDGAWNGVTLYGPQAARAFRTPLRAAAPGVNGWAHGFATYQLPGGFQGYGHSGETLSFHANLVVVPGLNLGIFVATNGADGKNLAADLPSSVVRQFYARPSVFARPGSSELAARAEDFEGRYLTTRRAYAGLEAFVDRLRGTVGVHVTPDGKLVTSQRGVRKVWVPEGPVAQGRFISTLGDERLVFRMAEGRAASFQTAANSGRFERLSPWRSPVVLLVVSVLAAIAALATLAGVPLRTRRESRENQIQTRAGVLQNIQALLWLVGLGVFAAWAVKASVNRADVVYDWPGALPIIASACALVATALTVVTFVALPAVWRGGRRVDSWPAGRKLAFTATVLIYAAFAVLLGAWNALLPWSG
ncbi:serine hydrolase domain-containing protein [Phenylobacterium deserti]|nr:serine hydrolase domain-containing protein [Phenylobacterium deserti]